MVRIVTMKAKHPHGFAHVIGKIAALFAIGRERWRNYTETSKREIDEGSWRKSRESLFFTLKKQPLLFVVMLCATSVVSYAEDTMTFVASSEVCTPITVNVGSHQYTVYGTLTISQVNGSVSATDCSGRKLKYEYSHSSSASYGSHDTYTFRNTYDVSRDSYSDGGSYYENTPSYDSAERVGNAVSSAVFGLGGGDEGEAYPALSALAGVSYAYGENLKIRYEGSGCNVYGSIGKDWLFDSDYKDKILWNVGIGSYFAFGGGYDPNMDVSAGFSIGQLAQWEKLSLMIDLDYTCWIGRRRQAGVFVGGGLGWGSFFEVFNTDDLDAKGGFAWNLEAGIVIRIASF